jgi:endonuclease G, mitochondrial
VEDFANNEKKARSNGNNKNHRAQRFGVPIDWSENSARLIGNAFLTAWDARTRNPRWTLELMDRESLLYPHEQKGNKGGEIGATRKKSPQFYEDDESGIPRTFRSKLNDFRGSGYDRGHLVAAGNFVQNQSEKDSTFTLANVSPQVGQGFNRDYWARFESYIRNWARDEKHKDAKVFVVTGPLFLPTLVEERETTTTTRTTNEEPKMLPISIDESIQQNQDQKVHKNVVVFDPDDEKRKKAVKWEMRYPLIGESPELVSVPTHFFKVILVDEHVNDLENTYLNDVAVGSDEYIPPKSAKVAAFVLPNKYIDPNTPLSNFAVSLTNLEAVSGLTFFPKAMNDFQTRDDIDRSEKKYLQSRLSEALRRQATSSTTRNTTEEQLKLLLTDSTSTASKERQELSRPEHRERAGPLGKKQPERAKHLCDEGEGLGCVLPPPFQPVPKTKSMSTFSEDEE